MVLEALAKISHQLYITNLYTFLFNSTKLLLEMYVELKRKTISKCPKEVHLSCRTKIAQFWWNRLTLSLSEVSF